ncbi:ApaLI family restriction endonuclease [Enterococcus casseliflavus]|uniref:ApaLI family restriction endonuclease n=1 Tax=Enterococcus casseliflavus TaxID=37734 RepID=A0A6G2FMI9_ENTCA|nr:ApaLI family restriction endonuclease [Enterococcus casseliflavus]MUN75775.1 ApaLI family restriction endonuclease [Enterococcus casseliflavus]
MLTIEQELIKLAEDYAERLDAKVLDRVEEMKKDDKSHYLIYKVLKVTLEEGELIDIYQNKGRFLYKYAGSFLEEAAILCFEYKFREKAEKKVKIPNTIGQRPKNFEIDCLINEQSAYEIKWRDATTDGDHITKEHTRMQVVKDYGYTPVRLMFYYPNRSQAMRIQKTLETLYRGAEGYYFYGDAAWEHVLDVTGVDLKGILERIANKNIENEKQEQEIAKEALAKIDEGLIN